MRNRAKCLLCKDILESFHEHDQVECSCGEISISGGLSHYYASARDFKHFLRVDDEGVEHPVRLADVDEKQEAPKGEEADPVAMLGEYLHSIERLPKHLLLSPITHSDLFCALAMVHAALRKANN